MDPAKWNTNSTTLREMIRKAEPSSELPAEVNEVDGAAKDESVDLFKLLGVAWDKQQDQFVFDFKEQISLMKGLPHTKRSILKIKQVGRLESLYYISKDLVPEFMYW